MIPNVINTQLLKKLPDKLIYLRNINTAMHPPVEEYVIFSPKNGKIGGIMHCHKMNVKIRPDFDGYPLGIDLIRTEKSGEGFGTALINFAKNYSKQIGSEGQICLKSVTSLSPMRIPHLFYRKQGFTTLDKKTDKLLDAFIKIKNCATYRDFPPILMYYPDKKACTKENFSGKINNFFNKIFHKD